MHLRLLRKAKVTDGILPDLTEQQLEKLGLALGEIVAFRKEAATLAAPPSTSAAAGGGVAAAAAALSSMSLSPAPSPAAASLVPSHHLPSVPMASLPPLTHACGEPGASGSVFKIEYQGKPAAAKEFHKHMRGMLSRELKSLQLLAHPNIVRVMAVIADAAAQPVGFIMEYVPVSLEEGMQRMTLRQALHALSEAAIGIAVAHDAHVIHR